MRILTVGNRYPPWALGGYEVTWHTTVAALRNAGHRVRVLTTGPDPTDLEPGTAPDPEVYRDLRWYWRAYSWPRLGLRETVALEQHNRDVFTRHASELEPDLVMWWAMGGMSLSLIELARRSGRPMLGAVGDDWMSYAPLVDGWMRRWRGPARLLAPVAERLVGVPARVELTSGIRWLFNSQFTLDRAAAAGWQLEAAEVVYPGVDQDRFKPVARDPWGWRLLVCGRIDPRKGIATAIEALALLPQDASLTIAGEGDPQHSAELRELVNRLGLSRRVTFTVCSRDELPALYAAADALLFPVLWQEPWGLVPLEAMAVGLPVIASRAGGGAWEYLREGENCLAFEPGHKAGLADSVRRLASDPEGGRELSSGGLLTARRYSEEAFHRALLGAVLASA